MNIYLAGKISGSEWRSSVVGQLLEDNQLCTVTENGDVIELNEFPILNNAILGQHNYTGPYRIFLGHGRGYSKHFEHNEHGFNEMSNDEWGLAKIQNSCLNAIKNSDLIIAVIDDVECYGTLFELGYAKALGKTIYIITTLMSDDNEDRIYTKNDFCPDEHYYFGGNELWFTLLSADKIYQTKSINNLDLNEAIRKLLNETFDYKQYLKSDKWKAIRNKILEKFNGTCVVCDAQTQVDVHHKTYKNIGHENEDDLIVLCRTCHAKFHEKPTQVK
jgi:hypothetical protein